MNSAQKQQLGFLKQAGSPFAMWTLALFVLGLGIGSFITQHPVFIVLFGFFVIVGLGSIETAKLLRSAIRAIDEGKPFQTQAVISVDTSSDKDEYHVQVRDAHQQWWKFEFIPQYWTPKTGEIEVTAYFLEGIEYPVLLIENEGILVPRYKPELIRR
jgi:hypothetical protein